MALWLALASLLCWCLAPISLVLGLLARNGAAKQGSPVPTQARLAIILGSVGTAILGRGCCSRRGNGPCSHPSPRRPRHVSVT